MALLKLNNTKDHSTEGTADIRQNPLKKKSGILGQPIMDWDRNHLPVAMPQDVYARICSSVDTRVQNTENKKKCKCN